MGTDIDAMSPSSPLRMPKATSTYTPTTQDPELRSQINTVLLQEGHIAKIQETLLHALHASPTNWPTLIQQHALSLLRSGEIHTFPQLMTQVMSDIQADSVAARESNTATSASTNGSVKETAVATRGHGENGQSLAVPKNVIEEGVRITRESLEAVCDFVE